MTDKDRQNVLAANAAFYAAFRVSDMKAMQALWSKRQTISVFHPNMRGITGHDAVMRSWTEILMDGAPPDVLASEPHVILSGNCAMVICDEELGYARMIATNIFKREGAHWRMVHHQAARLPALGKHSSTDPDQTGSEKN